MNMKFGINKTNLSKAFIARDKEIFADSRDREKKKRSLLPAFALARAERKGPCS